MRIQKRNEPPTANRGVQKPDIAQIDFNDLMQSEYNGMVASIDYLEFTIWDYDPQGVIKYILELSPEDFEDTGRGGGGYPKMLKANFGDIRILYGAANSDVMGIHVTIPGDGCKSLFGRVLPTDLFANLLENAASITRIDMALDNIGDIFYYPKDLNEYVMQGKVKSKWRTFSPYQSKSMQTGELTGDTVYLGSTSSDLFCRVYDKKLERNRINETDKKIDMEWVRWELVFKEDRAQAVVERLAETDYALGDVIAGVLKNYFNILQPGADSHRDRWKLDSKWAEFIGEIEPIRLYRVVKEKDILSVEHWLVKQCMPSLAAIFEVEGLDWIEREIGANQWRMSAELRSIIDEAKNRRKNRKEDAA